MWHNKRRIYGIHRLNINRIKRISKRKWNKKNISKYKKDELIEILSKEIGNSEERKTVSVNEKMTDTNSVANLSKSENEN